MPKYLRIESCKECPKYEVLQTAIDQTTPVCTALKNKELLQPNLIPNWCPLPSEVNFKAGTVLSLDDNRILSLYDKEGYKAGEINFGEKNVTFSGKLDKSSETLFSLLKYIIDPFFKDK